MGSGGVLRHGRPGVAERVLAGSTGEVEGGWQLPRAPRVVVDTDYVLAAVGLLAADHPEAAYRLARTLAEPGAAVGSLSAVSTEEERSGEGADAPRRRPPPRSAAASAG